MEQDSVHLRKLECCARCHEDHEHLTFRPLTYPVEEMTHWCPCPINGEPILLKVTAEE